MITAEEFYDEGLTPLQNMIEFAKMHRKAIIDTIYGDLKDEGFESELELMIEDTYPESNIK